MSNALKSVLPVVLGLGAVGVGVALSLQDDPGGEVVDPVVVTTDFSDGTGKTIRGKVDPSAWDDNGDGRLSPDEFQDRRTAEEFAKLDRNGDGFLSKDDRRPRGQGDAGRRSSGGRGGKAGRRGAPGAGQFAARAKEALEVSTLDHLTVATFPGPQRSFDRLDTDGDEELTAAELEAFEPRDKGKGKGNGEATEATEADPEAPTIWHNDGEATEDATEAPAEDAPAGDAGQ
ncbi:MAG: hypothetical protein GY913_05875 [Proteobacteria bacterium]|nr:hypothetical protein [Pseudomonadota bacterium]MCP4916433.1 hypothetical protein [Pseudomonadota bacterium]